MATSKTLAPTNVTISIPAMTDAPNASVISNCLDKEADAINALNSKIGKIHYIDTSLSSNKNTAVKRLHEKWSTFASYMATVRSSGIFCFEGFITFPAYSGGTELGTYYVYGAFNTSNSQGTVFLTQYHADDVWIYKNHGSSASAIKISGTSVDVT